MPGTEKNDIGGDAIYTPETDGAIHKTLKPAMDKIFLNLEEASLLSGLSQKYLTQMIDDGNLRAITDTEKKIRRSDLERL